MKHCNLFCYTFYLGNFATNACLPKPHSAGYQSQSCQSSLVRRMLCYCWLLQVTEVLLHQLIRCTAVTTHCPMHAHMLSQCIWTAHGLTLLKTATWQLIALTKNPPKTKKKTMSTMEANKYETKHADKTFQVVFLHHDTLPYRRVLCCVRNTHNNPSNILVVEIF